MKVYTTTTAAEELSQSVEVIRDHIRRGELRACNISRGARPQYRIREEDIAEFLERRVTVRPETNR